MKKDFPTPKLVGAATQVDVGSSSVVSDKDSVKGQSVTGVLVRGCSAACVTRLGQWQTCISS